MWPIMLIIYLRTVKIDNQARWESEQLDLVGGVPVHGRGLEIDGL